MLKFLYILKFEAFFSGFASFCVFKFRRFQLLFFVDSENANVVVDKPCGKAHFVWVERETRSLANARTHEAFVALNGADLRTIKAVYGDVLTSAEKEGNLVKFLKF